MKIFAVLTVLAIGSLMAGEEPRDLETIINNRKDLLTKIAAIYEYEVKNPMGSSKLESFQNFNEANLNLLRFCRDTAATKTEKIEWQKKIVQEEKNFCDLIEEGFEMGMFLKVNTLLAEEKVLAAQQDLLQIEQ